MRAEYTWKHERALETVSPDVARSIVAQERRLADMRELMQEGVNSKHRVKISAHTRKGDTAIARGAFPMRKVNKPSLAIVTNRHGSFVRLANGNLVSTPAEGFVGLRGPDYIPAKRKRKVKERLVQRAIEPRKVEIPARTIPEPEDEVDRRIAEVMAKASTFAWQRANAIGSWAGR